MPDVNPAQPRVIVLDLLQPIGGSHRLKAGETLRATPIGYDEVTKLPTTFAHRHAQSPADRQLVIVEPINNDSRYVAELLPEAPTIEAASDEASAAEPSKAKRKSTTAKA